MYICCLLCRKMVYVIDISTWMARVFPTYITHWWFFIGTTSNIFLIRPIYVIHTFLFFIQKVQWRFIYTFCHIFSYALRSSFMREPHTHDFFVSFHFFQWVLCNHLSLFAHIGSFWRRNKWISVQDSPQNDWTLAMHVVVRRITIKILKFEDFMHILNERR